MRRHGPAILALSLAISGCQLIPLGSPATTPGPSPVAPDADGGVPTPEPTVPTSSRDDYVAPDAEDEGAVPEPVITPAPDGVAPEAEEGSPSTDPTISS